MTREEEVLGKIPEIPADDIMDYYLKADRLVKLIVSGILEEGKNREVLIAVLDVDELEKFVKRGIQPDNSTVSYGLYKCKPQYIPTLVSTALGPFNSDQESVAGAASAICLWIAKRGEGFLQEIVTRVKELIHGV